MNNANNASNVFSIKRFWAIVQKESLLLRRDISSIMIMCIFPVILVLLLGFFIDMNPKKIPTAVQLNDNSVYVQEFLSSLENTDYFEITHIVSTQETGRELLKRYKVAFVITIPPEFTHDLLKGDTPNILFETDASDPAIVPQPNFVINALTDRVYEDDFIGPLSFLQTDEQTSFNIITHNLYNPELESDYRFVPGTIGLVIMLTMLLLMTVVSFRDKQEHTLEYLFSTYVTKAELLLGMVFIYVFVGYAQLLIGSLLNYFIFEVPFLGSFILLLIATFPYILCELSVGLAIASFSRTQLQAVQTTNIYIACALVITAFSLPYWGIPEWARPVSEAFPLTHYLRIIRGIMVKGSEFADIFTDLLYLACAMIVLLAIALYKTKTTLE